MKRKTTTAEEFAREMAEDTVVCGRLDARAARQRARADESRRTLQPLVSEAQRIGYSGATIDELVTLNAPLTEALVSLILSHLNDIGPREQETLVRALGAAAKPFDGSRLFDLFATTSDEAVRWAVVNTVSLIEPIGASTWLSSIKGTGWHDTYLALARQPREPL